MKRRELILSAAAAPAALAAPTLAKSVETWSPERTRKELNEFLGVVAGMIITRQRNGSLILARCKADILAHADREAAKRYFVERPDQWACFDDWPEIYAMGKGGAS